MRRAVVALAAAHAALLVGCPKDEHTPAPGVVSDAAPLTRPSALASAPSATVTTPPPTATAAPPKPCRAIAVAGIVRPDADAGAPLHPGETLGDALLSLGEGGAITAKDPTSARETTLDGPGLGRLCVANDAEAWVVRGGFSSVPGAGEAPGAEQWVVTPFGALRYAVALLKVTVAKDATTVRIIHGAAWALAKVTFAADAGAMPAAGAPHADPAGWTLIPEGTTATLSPDGDAKARVERCAAAAKDARALGATILSPDANVAELTPKHVEARRKARALCAIALVSAEAAASADLRAKARAADADWRRVGD